MEFVFEKGECNEKFTSIFYDKISIVNNTIIFTNAECVSIFQCSKITNIQIFKDIGYESFMNKRYTKIVFHFDFAMTRNSQELKELCFYHGDTDERVNKFIDFICSIFKSTPNKIDDIFDFLIGQKSFNENKDSL